MANIIINMSELTNIKLISGNSNIALSQAIANNLGMELTPCKIQYFANGEISAQIGENVRNCNVFILQTGSSDSQHSINDYIMELRLITDACIYSSAKSVSLIIPCFPYARGDKKDLPRMAIAGATTARILEDGIKRLICMDLHSGQVQGFLRKPFDNLYSLNLISDYLTKNYFLGLTSEEISQQYVLVSPDAGGMKRVASYAKKLGMIFVTMNKQRDYTKPNCVLESTIVGDPTAYENKTGILIDDMIDTMGTMVSASNELIEKGLKDVIVVATHGILSGPAISRINNCDHIKKVIVTNTLPQNEHLELCSKLEVVDISGLFAEVIRRLVNGGSISELFH